jgi:hypothetical protein
LTAAVLRQVAAREGLDFATALLYDRLRRSPEHGPFIRRVNAAPAEAPAPGEGPTTLVIVPGAFHAEYPHTGADGRRLRAVAERWGWRVAVIPVASFGRLAVNARLICDWLDARPEESVLLVSLSKGGADVKTALALPGTARAFRNVSTWVSLSGTLFGTPLAGWFARHPLGRVLARLVAWYHHYDFEVLHELDHGPGRPLDGDLVLPAHLNVLHVVGLPLAAHLSSRLARRTRRRLAALGPSDGGGTLLGDVARLPGRIYPVWGCDHYLNPRWDITPLIARLLRCARDGRAETVPGQVCAPEVIA